MLKEYASALVIGLFASQAGQAEVMESFDSGGWGPGWTNVDVVGTVEARAAHDGPFGLTLLNPNWTFNPGIVFGPGQTLSAWVHPRFFSADPGATFIEDPGRVYIGFAADRTGTNSLVVGNNTHELILQENNFIGYTNLNSVPYTFADQWYKLTIARSADGTSVTGRLFDRDGVTLLQTLGQTGLSRRATGIALRGFGQFSVDTIAVSAVPEPQTYAMLLSGLGALSLIRRRRTV